MSDAVNRLEQQLKEIKQGLYLIGPDRMRAMSTHETQDLVVKLQQVTDDALKQVNELTG